MTQLKINKMQIMKDHHDSSISFLLIINILVKVQIKNVVVMTLTRRYNVNEPHKDKM